MIRLSLVLAAFGTTVSAQWLNSPAPGIPRLPDGKPNLSAPTPRTADGKPDLYGIWLNEDGRSTNSVYTPHEELLRLNRKTLFLRQREKPGNGSTRKTPAMGDVCRRIFRCAFGLILSKSLRLKDWS